MRPEIVTFQKATTASDFEIRKIKCPNCESLNTIEEVMMCDCGARLELELLWMDHED